MSQELRKQKERELQQCEKLLETRPKDKDLLRHTIVLRRQCEIDKSENRRLEKGTTQCRPVHPSRPHHNASRSAAALSVARSRGAVAFGGGKLFKVSAERGQVRYQSYVPPVLALGQQPSRFVRLYCYHSGFLSSHPFFSTPSCTFWQTQR